MNSVNAIPRLWPRASAAGKRPFINDAIQEISLAIHVTRDSVYQILEFKYFWLDLRFLLVLTTEIESWVSGIIAIAKM